ncbi:MAG TPA: TetR family transcriptional regulator C-terminal domain-containing protein [Gaiellales bacterium]|jgi:AcrR family transcriptional regulator|nr:TetR family transcriptional regulator C-terminal domain-containing protein [Gaiellales bacterium]
MTNTGLTAKGAATRERIVEAAADLILARGAAGTSLDDIRGETSTSKSQLFHYFPGGKSELVHAIVACQGERVLAAQRPVIDQLDSWKAWRAWRDLVLAYYGQGEAGAGCPIGSLANELAASDPEIRRQTEAFFEQWQAYLERGLRTMQQQGDLRADANPAELAQATLASLQGGLVLTQTARSLRPLEIALDAALAYLGIWSTGRPAGA